MKKTKIVVIGDGIAAWSTLFLFKKEIFQSGNLDSFEIIQLADGDMAPICSHNSTAINSLRGTVKGLSSLGDLIVDSYEYFEALQKDHKFKGVEEGIERQFWKKDSKNKEKWEKRFPDFKSLGEFSLFDSKAYLITSEILGEDLKTRFFPHAFHRTFVTKIEDKKIFTTMGEFEFDKLILCLSNETKLFKALYKNVDEKIITHAKPVAGSFLEFDLDLARKGFSYALENHHLIYKNENKKLLIGSTTENQSDFYLGDLKKLKEIYDEVSHTFKNEIPIPPFEKGVIKTGIRQKGYKRLPFFGEVSEDIFSMHSLYKNGFTFAFLGAKNIVSKIFLS